MRFNIDEKTRKDAAIALRSYFGEAYTLISDATKIPLFYSFDEKSVPGVSLFLDEGKAKKVQEEIKAQGYNCHLMKVNDVFRFCIWAFCCAGCMNSGIFVFGIDSDTIIEKKNFLHLNLDSSSENIASETIYFTSRVAQQEAAEKNEDYDEDDEDDEDIYMAVTAIMSEQLFVPLAKKYYTKLTYPIKIEKVLKNAPRKKDVIGTEEITYIPLYTDLQSFERDYPDINQWVPRLFPGSLYISNIPSDCDYIVINPGTIRFMAEKNWIQQTAQEIEDDLEEDLY